jgi:DNA repair exonuclease SbcCD ATPase subunit
VDVHDVPWLATMPEPVRDSVVGQIRDLNQRLTLMERIAESYEERVEELERALDAHHAHARRDICPYCGLKV